MFHIMAGVAGVRGKLRAVAPVHLQQRFDARAKGAKMSLVPRVKKAFKSALGIQKSHKRSNPASVQLADEAAQRYF